MLNGQTRGQTGPKKGPAKTAMVGQATTTQTGFSHRHFRRVARMMLLDSLTVAVAYLGTLSATTIIAGAAYAQDIR
jgi:hypothetical protein